MDNYTNKKIISNEQKSFYFPGVWEKTSSSDQKLYRAISIVFDSRVELMDLFFHPSYPQLSASPDKIKKRASALCSGDELLTRVALDIWSESGGISFNEIYQKLDPEQMTRVITVLNFLK